MNRATSNRLLYILFIAQSMFSASQIAVGTLAAIVAVRLAGTESVAGIPSSATTFSQALMAFPIALLMGRYGRRVGLSLGYGLGALGGLVGLVAIAHLSFPLLLVSSVLLGVSRGSADQGRFAAGEMFPENERARMIGRLVFAGTIGAVVGPVLVVPSGNLLGSLGQNPDMGPWAGAFILSALSGLLIFFLLRPDPMLIARTIATENNKSEVQQPARPLALLLMLPKVQLAIIAALVCQTVMVVLMVMTPLYMDHHQHGRDHISLVIAAHTLGMYGLSAVTGYLIDRFGRISTLYAGALVIILSAVLSPLSANEYVLAATLFLLGLGWNFGYVASSSLLADALRGSERTRVQGINDALVFLAAGFGSLASGPLFAFGGYAAISYMGIVLAVMLMGFISRLGRPQVEPAITNAQ
ncbi:MAG: MFS transporter [Anaerolineae bacterium]|nr:MFS transporter [Anaerolineae bacterium]